jgi:hypothetical protein
MKSEFDQGSVNYFTEESIDTLPQQWQKQLRPELSDVILINPHKTMDWIGEFQRRYPHIPVVPIQSNDIGTVQTAYKKIEKMRQLPTQTIEMLGQDTWLALLTYLWLEDAQSFYLRLDGKQGAGYRYALEDTYQELPLILSSMEQFGVLTKTLANRAYACKQCSSIKLLIREGCPSCHSDLVLEQPLVHHFDCSYQSIEQHFLRTTDGILQCPKCKETLKHLGVDHDKPGTGYYCQACEHVCSDPSIQADCLNCQNQFKPTEEHLVNLYHYHLSNHGIQYLFNKNSGNSNAGNIIHSNSEFKQFYEAYLNLEKTSKLKSAIASIQLTASYSPAEKMHALLDIAKQLKTHLAPEQVMTFNWDTLYLLLPGNTIQQTETLIRQTVTSHETRLSVMNISDFSKLSERAF